jgi:hypothetical protein
MHMKEEVINKTLRVPSLLTQSLISTKAFTSAFFSLLFLFSSACLLWFQFAHVILMWAWLWQCPWSRALLYHTLLATCISIFSPLIPNIPMGILFFQTNQSPPKAKE